MITSIRRNLTVLTAASAALLLVAPMSAHALTGAAGSDRAAEDTRGLATVQDEGDWPWELMRDEDWPWEKSPW